VKSVISQSSFSVSQSGMSGVSEQSVSVSGSQSVVFVQLASVAGSQSVVFVVLSVVSVVSVVLESYKRLKVCYLKAFLVKDFLATDFLPVSPFLIILKAPLLT